MVRHKCPDPEESGHGSDDSADFAQSSHSVLPSSPDTSPAVTAPLTSLSSALDGISLLRRRALREARRQHFSYALSILNRLLLRQPDSATDYSNRGLVHFWNNQPQQALADYNRALTLNPNLASAYNNRANYFASQGALEAAIADYDRAIDLNPLNPRARINRAVTLRELQRYDAALDALDEALLFRRLTGHIYAERGRTYHLRGDWNCAIADYGRALEALAAMETEAVAVANAKYQQVKGWLQQLWSSRSQPAAFPETDLS